MSDQNMIPPPAHLASSPAPAATATSTPPPPGMAAVAEPQDHRFEEKKKGPWALLIGILILILVAGGIAFALIAYSKKGDELVAKRDQLNLADQIREIKESMATPPPPVAGPSAEAIALREELERTKKDMVAAQEAAIKKAQEEYRNQFVVPAEAASAAAAAELKRLRDAETQREEAAAAKAKADAEIREDKEIAANQLRNEVKSATKRFRPEGQFALQGDDAEERLKQRIVGWITQGGYSFPLMQNDNGLPTPIKGPDAPSFLAPVGKKWSVRTVTVNDPRGRGSYTTTGWAIQGSGPVAKK